MHLNAAWRHAVVSALTTLRSLSDIKRTPHFASHHGLWWLSSYRRGYVHLVPLKSFLCLVICIFFHPSLASMCVTIISAWTWMQSGALWIWKDHLTDRSTLDMVGVKKILTLLGCHFFLPSQSKKFELVLKKLCPWYMCWFDSRWSHWNIPLT